MEDVFRLKVKRKNKRKRYADNTKTDRNLVYIVRKISRGDYDPENKSDVIQARIAMSKGIIDKDFNIIKEEYLLCQTQRKQQY